MTPPQSANNRALRIEGQHHEGLVADSVHLNLPLIALPTAVGLANIYTPAAVAAVALISTAALVMSNTSARLRFTSAAFILPAVGALVALRPNYPGATASVVFFILACIAVLFTVATSYSRSSAVVSLFDGMGLLLLAAVVVRAAGIGRAGEGRVITGNLFTGGERVVFALAGTVSMAPAVAAAYLVAAIPIVKALREHRVYRLMGVGIALYVLVQSDRRSALYAAILIAAVIVVMPRRFRQLAPWIAGLLLLQPFLFRIFEGFTARSTLQTLAQSLPFQRSGEIGTGRDSLTLRLQIWSRAIDFYQDRIDPVRQAFGFGTFGQAESGASLTYREFFIREPGGATKTAHHSALQTLFDGGWIAAVLFVLAVVWAVRIVSRRGSPVDLAMLAMLISLSFVGSSEALLAPGYYQATPWWILLTIGMIAFSEDNPKAKQSPDPIPTESQTELQQRANTRSVAE